MMKNIFRGTVAAAFVATALLGAGCKDEGLDKLEEIKKKACACKDLKCIEDVQKDLEGAAKLKTKNADKAKAVGGEIIACIQKATEASMGAAGTPPAPEGGAAPAPGGAAAPTEGAAPAPGGAAAPTEGAAPAPGGTAPAPTEGAAPAPGGTPPAAPAPTENK